MNLPLIRYPDQQVAVISFECFEPDLTGTGGQCLRRRTGIATAVAVALLVGTGGQATSNYFLQRGQIGYGFPVVRYATREAEVVDKSDSEPTIREMLEGVRANLKLSVTELADALGVSRQTVYSWQDGNAISVENNERLAALYALSEGLLKIKPTWTRHELTRKLGEFNGTIFDAIASGHSPSEVITIVTAKRDAEVNRRSTLKTKLSTRQKKPLDDAEFGALDRDDQR